MVTAVVVGSTTIRASSEGHFADAPLTVSLQPPEHALLVVGTYETGDGPGIPYAVRGQSAGGVARGVFAARGSVAYGTMPDDVGDLTCLTEVDGMLVAAMYPSKAAGAAGASYAAYLIVRDRQGTPRVYYRSAGGGDPALIASTYCDPSRLQNFIRSLPISEFKTGVSRLEYPY